MSNIQTVTNQTPIEIALGIDENGMTTASKLYAFLQMSKAHYARWYKTNIEENQFAEENVDYFPFTTNGECGGQASCDSKITATFAKKLSMQQKNKRGEEARDYFVKVEDKSKDLALALQKASSDPMKMLEIHYQALKQVDKKANAALEEVQSVKKELEDFKETLPLLPEDADIVKNALNKRVVERLGGKDSNAYHNKSICQKAFADAYRELKRNFGVSSYKSIKRNQKAQALQIIEKYTPPYFLIEQINMCNAQQTLNMEGGNASMEIMSNVIAEFLFGVVRGIGKIFKKKEKTAIVLKDEQRESTLISSEQLAAAIRCIVSLAIIASGTIIVLNLEITKLGVLLGFIFLYILVYLGFRE